MPSTTARDTDWTAKLVDVGPDGFARNVQDGIVRARYREAAGRAGEPIEPGRVYEYTIDMWATSNTFLPGHRIRLEVSSSNFPRFDRNLNTGEDPATGTRMQKATADDPPQRPLSIACGVAGDPEVVSAFRRTR